MTTRRTRSKNIHTDLVRELRQRRSDGYGVMELAEHFGLSASSVSNVVNRRTHKNVLDLDDTPALPPLQTRFKPRTPVYHCAEGHLLKSKDAECVACVREATEAAKAKAAADAKAKVAADAKAKVAADAEAKAAADAKAKVAADAKAKVAADAEAKVPADYWSGLGRCEQGHVVVQRTPDGRCVTCVLLES